MGPGYRRVTAPLASSTAPWASPAPAPRAGPGGATEQHTARLGLILLRPHHQLPFGHSLCCWNKWNVLSCGSVRAGWGWQGTHLQHGGLTGSQAGPTPRGAGAGIGRRLCQRLAPRRAQGAELSSCSPAKGSQTTAFHTPSNVYFYINQARRHRKVSAASATRNQTPTHEKHSTRGWSSDTGPGSTAFPGWG